MAWTPWLTSRPWLPLEDVRPDVRRLLPRVSILAICHGVPDSSVLLEEFIHPRHLPEHPARILDAPILRLEDVDEMESLLREIHRHPCAVCLRRRVAIPVPTDDGDTEPLAWRRCPKKINRPGKPPPLNLRISTHQSGSRLGSLSIVRVEYPSDAATFENDFVPEKSSTVFIVSMLCD